MKFLYLFLISVIPQHSFHVAVADLEYDATHQSLEMSQRVFLDDLELAIRKEVDPNFNIDSETEIVKAILKQYFEEVISFKVNGKEKPFDFLGYKIDDDIVVIFIEVTGIRKLKMLEVENKTLLDQFSDQINLMHFKLGKKKKTFKFDIKRSRHTLIK